MVNAPRKREPTRTEPWVEDGVEVGVVYIYESPSLLAHLTRALHELADEGVQVISGACGFMSNIQPLAARLMEDTTRYVGVIMSSLTILMLFSQTGGLCAGRCVLILTSNSDAFSKYYDELVLPSWNVPRDNVVVVGLQDVDGFGAEVAAGSTVDAAKAEAGILRKVSEVLAAVKAKGLTVSGILSECTELPGYTNALRVAYAGLPVYDALSCCTLMLQARCPAPEYTMHATHA